MCREDGSGYAPCGCGQTDGGAADASGDASLDAPALDGPAPDAPVDGPAGGDGGNWTPKSLQNLVLWLDDDVGVVIDPQHPGTMLRWLDQSGNGNKADAMWLQDGFRFDVDPQVLNGHDAFRCPGGASLQIADVPSMRWGTGDFAIGMVVKINAQIAPMLWIKDIGYNEPIYLSVNQGGIFNFQAGQSNVVVAAQNAPSFHVVIGRGKALQLNVDGQNATGPTSVVNVDNPGAVVRLCTGSNLGAALWIAEVIAVKGTLSDPDAAGMRSYLKTKFAL